MAALVTLLLLGWLALVWCCSPQPGAANIARRGKATQSSDYINPIIGNATRAIDGVNDQIAKHDSCSHTWADWEAWWRLDLKQKYNINVIVVYGRADCCMNRMKDLELRIGDSLDNNNPVCGRITDYNNPTTTFCCNGMEGRYISMVIPGRKEYLHLCEVEVYGDPVTEENKACW